MGLPGIHDDHDLLALMPPVFQRALLKVPDDLIAQALPASPAAVADRIIGNLSPRRAEAVRATARRLLDSGELGPVAARTALRNLVRKVFDLAGPDAAGREGSNPDRPLRAAGAAFAAPAPPGAPGAARGPDLTPGGFAKLREARALFDAARRMSPFVQAFERAKLGANAAVLASFWLRAPGRVPRMR